MTSTGLASDVDDIVTTAAPQRRGLFTKIRLTLSRDPMARWVTAAVVVLMIVLVVLPTLISTSPTRLGAGAPLESPSGGHLLGTDQLGRDALARVVHGARLSMLVAFLSASFALLIGGVLGAVAASAPRWFGEVVMRFFDIVLAFPGILLAIVLAAAIGPSLRTMIIVLTVIYSPSMARVVRAAVFSEYGEDYVTAARLIGTRRIRLVGYHIGVNAALPVLVYTTLIMADAIVAEAALSFIGAGIKPPAPSWGNIIRDGQNVIDAGAWWLSVFPGLAMMLAVLGLNRFSEALGRRLRSQ
jgi:ABC-type dipeptide/oligopeptide/nickel transport system permease subunit